MVIVSVASVGAVSVLFALKLLTTLTQKAHLWRARTSSEYLGHVLMSRSLIKVNITEAKNEMYERNYIHIFEGGSLLIKRQSCQHCDLS